MKIITTTRQGCVVLCFGALSVLVPAEAAGAAPACMSVEARQADEAQASAYLVSRGYEPSRAAAVVRKLNGGGVHCW